MKFCFDVQYLTELLQKTFDISIVPIQNTYKNDFCSSVMENNDIKRLINNMVKHIVNVVYNEIYIYIWFICFYNVFLFFIILANLFLLLKLLKLNSIHFS
jgi:ABC-type bacteriocin/lantibiotic exporter with double-glycine peptidase domain